MLELWHFLWQVFYAGFYTGCVAFPCMVLAHLLKWKAIKTLFKWVFCLGFFPMWVAGFILMLMDMMRVVR